MGLWVWVAIIVGVLLAVVLLAFLIGTPARRREAKRREAADLRREADENLVSAARREASAKQEQAAADRERLAAEERLQEANAVDPDLPEVTAVPDDGPGSTLPDSRSAA